MFNRWAFLELLAAKHLTKAEVAKTAKVPRSYITELCNGAKRKPGLPVIRKLARALDVAPQALYFDLPKHLLAQVGEDVS